MRAAEEAAFARGISAEALMEQAGAGIARAVAKFFPRAGKCIVFAGKGHNAGDALVAARWLAQAGWQIETRLVFPEKELSALTSEKLRALREGKWEGPWRPDGATPGIGAQRPLPHFQTIILDGLLGLGAHPPLREPIRGACREINSLGRGAPTSSRSICLRAWTANRAQADDDCVGGRLHDHGRLREKRSGRGFRDRFCRPARGGPARRVADPTASGGAGSWRPRNHSASLLPRRKYSAYKNQFGRIGIVAGSRGFTGAAIMCSLGALRAGAGLVELFVPEEIYEIIAAAAAPEVMVKPVKSYADLLEEPIDVWAVGPGLGKSRASGNSRAHSRSQSSRWWSTPTGSTFLSGKWRP